MNFHNSEYYTPMVKALDEWITVYIALGSNLFDKSANLEKSIDILSGLNQVEIVQTSTFLMTKAQGFDTENDFVNAVIEIKTKLYPEHLLQELLAIEQRLGRERVSSGYTDRPIDLDIVAFGDILYESEALTIPHPEMHKRDFVLRPMCEIAPNWRHPKLNKSATLLLSELP